MNEDQIIARARFEVAARRAQQSERRWSLNRHWLPAALALATLLAFLAVPAPLSRKLLLAMSGVCSLRPAHSYFAGGVQFPLESRMMGIYGGFLLTLGWLLLLRRAGARRLGSPATIGLLLAMFTSMVFDGLNSTFFEIGWPHLYAPTNAVRLLTGLLAGIAIAPGLTWLLARIALLPTALRQAAVVRSPWELLMPLAVTGGFAALVTAGQGVFYYPLAIITVAGVAVALAGAILLPVLTLGRLDGRITRPAQLVGPAAIALLVAFAVLASTAAVRWSVTGPL